MQEKRFWKNNNYMTGDTTPLAPAGTPALAADGAVLSK